MPILTDRAAALVQLRDMVQASVDPVLAFAEPTDELQVILDKCQVASVWEADTEYPFGSVVIPTANNRNGHRYKLVYTDGTGITSGATEPSWSTSYMSRVVDNDLTWEEAGADVDSLWDLNKAAYLGWMAKAGKAAARFGFSADNQAFQRNQIYQMCLQQASRFVFVEVA